MLQRINVEAARPGNGKAWLHSRHSDEAGLWVSGRRGPSFLRLSLPLPRVSVCGPGTSNCRDTWGSLGKLNQDGTYKTPGFSHTVKF